MDNKKITAKELQLAMEQEFTDMVHEVVEAMINRCKAFIFPGEEDFGITPVEAQAAGKPVIAFKAGGALETVIDGETGVFFEKQNEESLCNAISDFKKINWSQEKIRNNAEKFSKNTRIS